MAESIGIDLPFEIFIAAAPLMDGSGIELFRTVHCVEGQGTIFVKMKQHGCKILGMNGASGKIDNKAFLKPKVF